MLNDAALSITYDGDLLDPQKEVLHDTSVELPLDGKVIHVRVIEWRTGKHRAIYFGADNEHFVHEESGSDVESQLPFSAYVTLDGFDESSLGLMALGDMAPDEFGDAWRAVRTCLRDHFAARRREKRREQVVLWKENGAYPYEAEPQTEPEKAERAVFDAVSGALAPHIPKKKQDAKLTLTLLRDAIRHDPEQLSVILHEVVALSQPDREALTRLLSETSLSAIIRSANLIASRHKFLAALEHLLFGSADDELAINERDHLHKLLERELWVFGEEYHLMASERGLTEMLRNHLKLEGLPIKGVEPVKRWDGSTGRADLHLAAQYSEHDRVRHLVVELKAPDITTKRKELDQIEDYANVVLKNPAFATENATWDFMLIVTDYDEVTENRISKSQPGLGLFLEPEKKSGRPAVRAFVRRWRDIIDENKRRLEFVTASLETDPSITEGIAFVREQYADILPPADTEAK